MEIIVKSSYAHINRSLPNWDSPQGRIVKNRDHYDRLCKENGMVSYEKAEEMADIARKSKIKPYEISKDALAIIKAAKNSSDNKGNVKLGDKVIKAMIDKKIIGKKIPSYMQLPSSYNGKGGFTK